MLVRRSGLLPPLLRGCGGRRVWKTSPSMLVKRGRWSRGQDAWTRSVLQGLEQDVCKRVRFVVLQVFAREVAGHIHVQPYRAPAVRKGSVIMVSTVESGTHVGMAGSCLTRFAAVFAQRPKRIKWARRRRRNQSVLKLSGKSGRSERPASGGPAEVSLPQAHEDDQDGRLPSPRQTPTSYPFWAFVGRAGGGTPSVGPAESRQGWVCRRPFRGSAPFPSACRVLATVSIPLHAPMLRAGIPDR